MTCKIYRTLHECSCIFGFIMCIGEKDKMRGFAIIQEHECMILFISKKSSPLINTTLLWMSSHSVTKYFQLAYPIHEWIIIFNAWCYYIQTRRHMINYINSSKSSYQCQISDMIKQDSAMCMVVPACESCCQCTIFLNSCQARALSSLKWINYISGKQIKRVLYDN